MKINSANPTVSTASDAFVVAAKGADGWADQVWDHTVTVPCVTLDGLIATHGQPAFVKVDVEGFEHAVLEGLSRPVKHCPSSSPRSSAMSLMRASNACEDLGDYRFNIALGESQA
jgi:hypothetical protein